MHTDPLQNAVDLAGGQSVLARALSTPERKIAQGHVWKWLQAGKAPLEHAPAIETLTGVRCEALRPDVSWNRDEEGRVTGYTVPLAPPADVAA